MKLKLLCDACGATCPEAEEEREIAAVAVDSRLVTAGCLFVCIRGLHTDGHDYIKEAVARGACCVLTERGASYATMDGILYLECDNTRAASACLFDAWYGFPSKRLKMIGVTGTNGKTSVTHMLRAILEACFCKCGLIGTVGCESKGRHLDNTMQNRLANMTTPDPPELYRMLAEMAEDGVEYVLMEVTSHALVLGKLAPIEFEAAVFTNLTPEHLDFHGDMEHYADAKASLFKKSRISVINADDLYAAQMLDAVRGRAVTASLKGRGDYLAEITEGSDDFGVRYKLSSESRTINIACPIPGQFTVMNSMQAAIVALELGFSPRSVKDALAGLFGIKGRMERVRLGPDADFTVWIDYAHTPDALENLLRTAKQFKKADGRLTVLFGCGGDRDRSKRPMMGRVAAENADRVIITSDNSRSEEPRSIIDEILLGISDRKGVAVIENRREAIRYAVKTANKHEILLLAGKGHEEYEIDRNGKHPFCEKEIVLEAFDERLRGTRN